MDDITWAFLLFGQLREVRQVRPAGSARAARYREEEEEEEEERRKKGCWPIGEMDALNQQSQVAAKKLHHA